MILARLGCPTIAILYHQLLPYAILSRNSRLNIGARACKTKFGANFELGFYRADGQLARSEYVMSLYTVVKMRCDARSMQLIVEKFSRHFDPGIQQAVITRRFRTIDELIELLDGWEHIGEVNAIINRRISHPMNSFFGVTSDHGTLNYNRQTDRATTPTTLAFAHKTYAPPRREILKWIAIWIQSGRNRDRTVKMKAGTNNKPHQIPWREEKKHKLNRHHRTIAGKRIDVAPAASDVVQ